MRWAVTSLALFGLAACVRRSPERAILSAFGPLPYAVRNDEPRPVYVTFADEESARVFKEVLKRPGVVMASPRMLLTCDTANKRMS